MPLRNTTIRPIIKKLTKPMQTTRRSHEDRRKETRAKLIAATIQVINDKGFAAMRTGDITKKAGVTWGAAQHLFGGKTELLTQVASNVSETLVETLETDVETDLPAQEKISMILDQTWALYSNRVYFAMVEIVRGTRKDPIIHDSMVAAQVKITEKIERLWIRIFKANDIEEEKVMRLCHLVTLYLAGLAARKIYAMPATETEKYISYIKDITISEIVKELA